MVKKASEKKDTVSLILRAIALAMGTASVVLPLIGINQPITLVLGIGLFCLALAELNNNLS